VRRGPLPSGRSSAGWLKHTTADGSGAPRPSTVCGHTAPGVSVQSSHGAGHAAVAAEGAVRLAGAPGLRNRSVPVEVSLDGQRWTTNGQVGDTGSSCWQCRGATSRQRCWCVVSVRQLFRYCRPDEPCLGVELHGRVPGGKRQPVQRARHVPRGPPRRLCVLQGVQRQGLRDAEEGRSRGGRGCGGGEKRGVREGGGAAGGGPVCQRAGRGVPGAVHQA
jgi:hypothetical protein